MTTKNTGELFFKDGKKYTYLKNKSPK